MTKRLKKFKITILSNIIINNFKFKLNIYIKYTYKQNVLKTLHEVRIINNYYYNLLYMTTHMFMFLTDSTLLACYSSKLLRRQNCIIKFTILWQSTLSQHSKFYNSNIIVDYCFHSFSLKCKKYFSYLQSNSIRNYEL